MEGLIEGLIESEGYIMQLTSAYRAFPGVLGFCKYLFDVALPCKALEEEFWINRWFGNCRLTLWGLEFSLE